MSPANSDIQCSVRDMSHTDMLRKLQIALPAALLVAVIFSILWAASPASPMSMGDPHPMGYHVHNMYGEHGW